MSNRKRYALIGTGDRARMFVDALAGTFTDHAELVALCDISQVRMNWHNERMGKLFNTAPRPTYRADQFDTMIAETKPDVVIVSTIDVTHNKYINRAMELGCDVITEKPMTIDVEKLRTIFETIERTGRSLRVTFNYRYNVIFTKLRELIVNGVVGWPLHVDFTWLLDAEHGANYFRRWHAEKEKSGGLLVHKSTHHFDLVNWWIGSVAQEVYAMGSLSFYGQAAAESRGEHYDYDRYTGHATPETDPFAISLKDNDMLRGLYLDAEAESGYIRDRNVFGKHVNIEDTMNATVRYRNGALLSYALVAYSPWEGLRVAVTGTKGRIELDLVEAVARPFMRDEQGKIVDPAQTIKDFQYERIWVFPLLGVPYNVEIPRSEAGGHGGADPLMLQDIFLPNPPPDPYKRAATHIDGAASILVGISANQSILHNCPVVVDSLFKL
jgi:predicted dehydrogenase